MPTSGWVQGDDVDGVLSLSTTWVPDHVNDPPPSLLQERSSRFGSSDLVVVFAVISAPIVHEPEWRVDDLGDVIDSFFDPFLGLQDATSRRINDPIRLKDLRGPLWLFL